MDGTGPRPAKKPRVWKRVRSTSHPGKYYAVCLDDNNTKWEADVPKDDVILVEDSSAPAESTAPKVRAGQTQATVTEPAPPRRSEDRSISHSAPEAVAAPQPPSLPPQAQAQAWLAAACASGQRVSFPVPLVFPPAFGMGFATTPEAFHAFRPPEPLPSGPEYWTMGLAVRHGARQPFWRHTLTGQVVMTQPESWQQHITIRHPSERQQYATLTRMSQFAESLMKKTEALAASISELRGAETHASTNSTADATSNVVIKIDDD